MIVLDTCVVSELAKREPAPAVLAWFESIPEESLRLSVLTLGEIRKGVELLEQGERRDRLSAWLAQLGEVFADRLLPVDTETALRWGALCARARRSGRTPPAVDTLLAATAERHGLTLATRNVADFEECAALVVNPWRHEATPTR